MANPKQFELIQQGVEVWNKWREDFPDEQPDLSKTNFHEADLSGADLSGADLSEANISWANLHEVNLSGGNLHGADLGRADLCKANLHRTVLCGANLRWADLRWANLSGADLGGANLSEASLRKANLNEANLSEVNLSRTILREASLRKTNLSRADLSEAILNEANLDRATLVGATLRKADLKRANLEGAILSEAVLIQADLCKANITGVRLYGTVRDEWIIDGIKCDYVYWNSRGQIRTPKARDFRPREFEERYKFLPTFKYIFERRLTLVDITVMDKIVYELHGQHSDWQLKIDSFHLRGQPHAKFTVSQEEFVEQAQREVKHEYETQIKALETRSNQANKQLRDFMAMLIDKSHHIELIFGDKVGGDSIKAEVSGDLKQVAIGKDIQQNIPGNSGQEGPKVP